MSRSRLGSGGEPVDADSAYGRRVDGPDRRTADGSRQTVYRQLKAEGVTFETVLDELRHKLAVHYLSGQKTSVNETAYLVGFSEPAAFSRAFKRWTGTSPRSLRTADDRAARG